MQLSEEEKEFDDLIKEVRKLYCSYHYLDIIRFANCLSLWLPNVASVIKNELIFSILFTIPIGEFSKISRSSYIEFREFYNNLSNLIPEFHGIEDFVPEMDWGEISFYANEDLYKILYGGNFANTFDYIDLFELVHYPFSDVYQKQLHCEPKIALSDLLKITNDLIESVPQKIDDSHSVSPGHWELPSEAFWDSLNIYLDEFNKSLKTDSYAKSECIFLGELSLDVIKLENFLTTISDKPIVEKLLIQVGDFYFIFLPRNYFHILYNIWGGKLKRVEHRIRSDAYQLLMYSFGRYMALKFGEKQVLPSVKVDGIPEVFPLAISDDGDLILFQIENIFKDPDYRGRYINIDYESIDVSKIKIMGMESQLSSTGDNTGFSNKKLPKILKIISLVIHTDINSRAIELPDNFSAEVFFALDFIGILNSVDSIAEIFEYFKFREEYSEQISIFGLSAIDIFAAFKQSHGMLNTGALVYDLIGIDPIGGGRFRYEHLKLFLSRFPFMKMLENPFNWKILSDKHEFTTVLVNRINSNFCRTFVYEEFHLAVIIIKNEVSREDAIVADLISDCLIYNLKEYLKEIMPIIRKASIEPIFLIMRKDKGNDPWQFVVSENTKEFFLLYNIELISNHFIQPLDRRMENKLVLDFISFITGIYDLSSYDLYLKLESDKDNLPGFQIVEKQMEYSYPQRIKPLIIKENNKLKIRKKIALFCRDLGIQPGIYGGDNVKNIIDSIRDKLIYLINSEIDRFTFLNSIEHLIKVEESLYVDNKKFQSKIINSTNQKIDYKRDELLANKRGEFLEHHRAIRYLISKFVASEPSGVESLEKELPDLQSLAEEIIRFYSISDNIYYVIAEDYEIEIFEDYILSLKSPDYVKGNMEKLELKKANERIYRKELVLKFIDTVVDKEMFIKLLDHAFLEDFGFKVTNLLKTLDLTCFLPDKLKQTNHFGCVNINKATLVSIIAKDEEVNASFLEIEKIIDFLTLKKDEVQTTLTKDIDKYKKEKDIPIWEYSKRHSRFEIKPFILYEDNIIFGTGSAYESLLIWSGCITRFYPPYDMKSKNIKRVFENAEFSFQKNLVNVTFKIIEGATSILKKELEVKDVIGGSNTYGDIDVFAYLKELNIFLNIECKYVRETFCIKDSKRARDKIFYGSNNEKGYLEKVEVRHTILIENIKEFFKYVNADDSNSQFTIVKSVFVTSDYNYWTLNPPLSTDVDFVYIEDLKDYIDNLYNI